LSLWLRNTDKAIHQCRTLTTDCTRIIVAQARLPVQRWGVSRAEPLGEFAP